MKEAQGAGLHTVKAAKPICAHVLIVCKCKAKVRNRKGFGPKFMHTCAFCVLFPESASGSPPSCVSHQGDFAYILSNRASESRLVKRQKMLIFANIEDVGRHPLFLCARKAFLRSAFPFFCKHRPFFQKPWRYSSKHCRKFHCACKHSDKAYSHFYETLRKLHSVSIFTQKATL